MVLQEPLLDFGELDQERRLVLTAAFIAGNVEVQLNAGKAQDMPLAGVELMVDVYAKLKQQDAELNVPGIEAFRQAREQGRLAEAVDEAVSSAAP